METVVVEIPDSKAYLVPMGDLHIGDKGFDKTSIKHVKGYVKWVKERKNARVFLMGDIMNTATVTSKSSVFQQNMSLNEQLAFARELFEPIKEQIVGAIEGNHEDRLEAFAGMSATEVLCNYLDVKHCGYSAILSIKVGKKKRLGKLKNRMQYTGYMHHTTGGGSTLGSKVNRVAKLTDIVTNGDFYCGAHNHALFVVKDFIRFKYDKYNEAVTENEAYIVGCGGYLNWHGNYPEKMGLLAVGRGSPRIRLDGIKKDVHAGV